MIVAYAVSLALLSGMNAYIAKSYLYPPAVFAALWSGLLVGLVISQNAFYAISSETLMVYLLGAVAFSAGGFLALLSSKGSAVPRQVVSPQRRSFVHVMLYIGLVVLVLLFPFYWRRLVQLSAASGYESFWVGLRYQIGYGYGEGLGVFAYLITLARFLALVAFYENDGSLAGRFRAYSLMILALTYDILSAARYGAILLVFGLIGVDWIRSGRIKVKPLLAGTVALLLIFFTVAILLEKGWSLDKPILENVKSVLKVFRLYVLGGLVAFDSAVRDPSSFSEIGRISTLRFFFAIANAFGAKIDLPRFVTLFTMTPRPTNVYTIYFSYFLDYGWAGVVMIMFALGGLMAWIYLAASRGNPQAAILYGMMLGFLMVSNSNEGFLTALSYWIQAISVVFVLYRWPLFSNLKTLTPRQEASGKAWIAG